MAKGSRIFLKIDEFIFQKLDYLKDEGVFQKFNDIISNLNENHQKIIAQVTTFVFLFFPFIFVIFLWWGNWQTKKSLEIKKQILEQIAFLDGNKNALASISSGYPFAITSQDDLNNKIRHLLSVAAIDQQKVTIANFQQTPNSQLSSMEATLNFSEFGIADFSNFARMLIESEKFKIVKMNIVKNQEKNLLEGSLSLVHVGKSAFSQQE